MAGEWIKMECTLPEKPEVMRIARLLSLDPDAVVGKLVRLWGWVDGVSVDGVVDGVVVADVDQISKCAGFAAALVKVGWLRVDEAAERITFPNFDTHNGETAKQRALKNRRQAKWRAGASTEPSTAPSTPPSTTASTREEKRREEEEQKKERAAPKAKKSPKAEQTFAAWVASLGDALTVPDTDPVFDYAAKVGLPAEFVALAWNWFDTTYGEGGDRQTKTYADWRAVFRKAVAGGWPKYWGINRQGEFYLTTEGEQARRAAQ